MDLICVKVHKRPRLEDTHVQHLLIVRLILGERQATLWIFPGNYLLC